MTIVVGYVQGEGGTGGVQLGAMLAESLSTDLVVASVVPKPWTTPSMAKVDAEFSEWTDQIIAKAHAEVDDYMTIYPPQLEWRFQRLDHRTASAALIDLAMKVHADAIAISSSGDGQLGQIIAGSTADALLHRSPVAVGLSPRGYRSPRDGQLKRVSVAISGGTDKDRSVLVRARELADRMNAPLRVVTFAVRGGAMYPPLVGLNAEEAVLDQWKEQASAAHEELRKEGLIPERTKCEVASGRGWREAVDSIDWVDGEVLFVGSTREGRVRGVFLGSRATKLLRHASVPVVVLPR